MKFATQISPLLNSILNESVYHIPLLLCCFVGCNFLHFPEGQHVGITLKASKKKKFVILVLKIRKKVEIKNVLKTLKMNIEKEVAC